MKISAEQAHVIFDIYRDFGIGTQWFDPKAIYPNWMNKTAIGILDDLFNAGMAERKKDSTRYRLKELALKAYDEWAQADRFKKLRRVWFKSALGGTCSTLITVTGPIEQVNLETVLAGDPDFMGISMV